jgi:hypothetical protein
VVPSVGLENSVFYFLYGDALDEPDFLRSILCEPNFHLLLDLHNLHTMAENFDFDPEDYLRRLPLERVVEIHIAGGKQSDPQWLEGQTMRLDSHDHAVPEEVWLLLESVARRCPNLRGLTLERMEGTVTAQDVAPISEELQRAKRIVQPGGGSTTLAVPACFDSVQEETALVATEEVLDFEERVASAMRSEDVAREMAQLSSEVRADGARLSALLITRLRFERLTQASATAASWYEEDPRSFARAFADYHREVPPTAGLEASDFATWCEEQEPEA